MRPLWLGLVLTCVAAFEPSAENAGNVTAAIKALPGCARSCFIDTVNQRCDGRDTLDCICNDGDFEAVARNCFRDACSFPETFGSLREVDVLCARPRRDRRMEAWPYISIHIFGLLCAVIRVYTKTFIIKKFSPEDWLSLSCFLMYIVYFGIGHHALMSAFGQDIWWIQPDDLAHALKLFWVDCPVYSLLLGLTKISIILFYIRLCHLYKTFCRICWAFMVIIALYTLLFIFLTIFQCAPIRWNWDRFRGQRIDVKCLDLNALQWAINITNIVFDFVVLVLPIPLVAKMKSTLRRKVAIIFMFSLGIVVLVASCLKMRYNILYGHSHNITWDYMDLMVWAGIETSVSLAAPCLPTVRLFLHSVFPNFFGRMFAFGAHGETTLDEYIKAEEDEVAQWSADVEKRSQDSLVKRPRPAVTVTEDGRVQLGSQESGRRKKPMSDVSRILNSVDNTPVE